MKQLNIIWRAAALLPLVLVLVFASCDSPLEPDSGASLGTEIVPVVQTGKASVNFSISGGMARTVLPDLSEVDLGALSYTLTGKRGEETEEPLAVFSASGTTLALEPGNWTFTLNAENTEEDIVLSARAEVTLAADKTNEVVFALKPSKEGTGNVNISFTFPVVAGITSVTTGGDITAETITLPPGSDTWSYQDTGVEARDYFATFSFYRGSELIAAVSETIQVRDSYTSKKTITLSLSNLKGFVKPVGDTLAAKLQWIKTNAVNDTYYLVEVIADETIARTTLEYSGKTGVSITLIGIDEQRTISLSGRGSIFTVGSGVTLALENNITLKGITMNFSSLVMVNTGGTLVMNDGAKITNHSSTPSYNGTVYVAGVFTINGGEISGNTAGASGGGVYVDGGAFTMNGGEISGNTANSGGGVCVASGTFTMNSGVISNNTGSIRGGGVGVRGGVFTMSGGEISGNTAKSGGGVDVGGTGNFTMSGGVISGNTANGYVGGIGTGIGGGVYVDGGAFTMSGGVISGNTANGDVNIGSGIGGGVYVDGGAFTMSGGEISGNTASIAGGGVCVSGSGVFSKTGGIIYGKEIDTTFSNNAIRGYAVHWSEAFFRNSMLGENDGISTADTGTGWEHPEAEPLVDSWNPGTVAAGGDEWFAFTASAANQLIHVKFGELKNLSLQVYDSAWQTVGSGSNVTGGTTFKYLSGLSADQVYYINVRPVGTGSGNYEIAVNESPMAPGTDSTALDSGWKPGTLEAGGEQWFTFIASAANQYIHVKFGTLKYLNVQVYDSELLEGSSSLTQYSSTKYRALTDLSAGQTYCIKVVPYSGYSGDYEIMVSESPMAPGTVSTHLESGWNPGSIETRYGDEWFTFNASTVNQYVRVKFGVLNNLYIQVYDSAGQSVGGGNLSGSTTFKYLTGLTVGQPYHIRVFPDPNYSGYGDYQIAASESPVAPGAEVTPLVVGWNPGSIVAGGEEWFMFTAVAGSQNIHVQFKSYTLDDFMMEVYDSSWQPVGEALNYTRNRLYLRLNDLNINQTYYIRTWPRTSMTTNGGSGNYDIAVNGSIQMPSGTEPALSTSWRQSTISAYGRDLYTFNASAESQYIHIKFISGVMLSDLNIQVYDSALQPVGETSNIVSWMTLYKTLTSLSVGQKYFVDIWVVNSPGTYQVALNTSETPPN